MEVGRIKIAKDGRYNFFFDKNTNHNLLILEILLSTEHWAKDGSEDT